MDYGAMSTDVKKAPCTHPVAILLHFSDILQVNQTLHLNINILSPKLPATEDPQ